MINLFEALFKTYKIDSLCINGINTIKNEEKQYSECIFTYIYKEKSYYNVFAVPEIIDDFEEFRESINKLCSQYEVILK